MSEFCFGVTQGRCQPRAVARLEGIARRNGATFVYGEFPGMGWRGWFTAVDHGFPFTRDLAVRVCDKASDVVLRYEVVDLETNRRKSALRLTSARSLPWGVTRI